MGLIFLGCFVMVRAYESKRVGDCAVLKECGSLSGVHCLQTSNLLPTHELGFHDTDWVDFKRLLLPLFCHTKCHGSMVYLVVSSEFYESVCCVITF